MKEEWRSLDGLIDKGDELNYGEVYEVSSRGDVRTTDTGRTLVKTIDRYGYFTVALLSREDWSKRKRCTVHRLVALAFIPKIEGKDVVNHKDMDKLNNHVSNLEWSTVRGNTIHAMENNPKLLEMYRANASKVGKKYGAENGKKGSKPVVQYDLVGNALASFPSQIEASRQTGVGVDVISYQCNNVNSKPKYNKFYFRYASSGARESSC